MITAKIISFILGTIFGGGIGMIITTFLVSAQEQPADNCNRCVCCGEVIPEGRQVCPKCEKGEQRK